MSDDFRDGIVNLNTRQFSRVVELLIKVIYNQVDSDCLSYDLVGDGHRVEVKSSRVLKSNKLALTTETLYDLIINNSNKNRLISQKDIDRYDFDCNIQQIKIDCFDILYYVLFFYDVIEVFTIPKDKIISDRNIKYSEKQHRGNLGEGQFHINNATYMYHKEKYYEGFFTYETLKERLLDQKK